MTNSDKTKTNKRQLRHRNNVKKQPKTFEKNGSSNDKDMTDDEILALEMAAANNKTGKPSRLALGIGAGVVVIVALLVSSLEWPPLLFGNNNHNNNNDTLSTATTDTNTTKNETPPQIEKITKIVSDFKILRRLPHDTQAFTQGLTFRPDNHSILYECTGMYKASKVRVLDLQSDNNNQQEQEQEQEQEETVLQHFQIPDEFFGEGMTFLPAANNHNDHDNDDTDKDNLNPTPGSSGRLVFLTWREKTGFVLDVDTLQVLENFTYETTTGEGWGIVHVPTPPKDNDNNTNTQREPYDYIVTDGSDHLLFWDRHYRETHKVPVTFRTSEMAERHLPPRSLKMLNELEWDATTGTLLANIWFQDYIARIDPRTGFVTTLYDLRSLYTDRHPQADVFNGIALNSQGDLWVTGKYWPFLYQIQLGDD